MDKKDKYRNIVTEVTEFYASLQPEGDEGIQMQEVLDSKNDQYLVFAIGWDGERRVHDCVMHIALEDGKVLIQEDTTDLPVSQVLEEKGVDREDLVLGFYKRIIS
ncbi:MAG: element excision factor XisI family protein [Spirochaetota bacterium]